MEHLRETGRDGCQGRERIRAERGVTTIVQCEGRGLLLECVRVLIGQGIKEKEGESWCMSRVFSRSWCVVVVVVWEGGAGQGRRVWLTVIALTGSREAGKGEVNHPHTVPRPWRSPQGWN